MTASGPRSPTAASHVAGIYSDWVNPTNALASDDSYATTVMVASPSDILRLGSFGDFGIAAGSTINGLHVEVEGKSLSSTITMFVNVKVSGATKGQKSAGFLTTEAYKNYGGAADVWGQTYVDTDFADGTFELDLQVFSNHTDTLSIDHARVTVYYTLPAMPFSKISRVAVRRASYH